MFRIIHLLLVLAYALLPVGMIWWTVGRRNRARRAGPLISLLILFLVGILVGVLLVLLNTALMNLAQPAAIASSGSVIGGSRLIKISPAQIDLKEAARLIYFVIGALCLIRVVDRLTFRGIFKLAKVPLDQWLRPISPNQPRALLSLFAQRLLMLMLIIPYLISLMMVYRPRVHLDDTPVAHDLNYSNANFNSGDGIQLAGWWISAAKMPAGTNAEMAEDWGKRTVLLCHGVGSAKERQLELARYLVDRGYNILVFDFRGHGESTGNFISYGIRERFDVLAAISWVKANHQDESKRLFGIGANSGAAALLYAAVEPGCGEQLDGIVLYEPFARFDDLVRENARHILPGPTSWLVRYISVPLASLHAGGDLGGFAPIELIDQVWPRPVLIVHGRGQTFVPSDQSMDLYQQASQPKEQFFPADNYVQQRARARRYHSNVRLLTEMFKEFLGTSDSIGDDAGVRYRTMRFLHDAQAVPIL